MSQVQTEQHPTALPPARHHRSGGNTPVAPAEPFKAALDAWVRGQELEACSPLNHQRRRSNSYDQCAVAGLQELALAAGLPVERLRSIRSGRQKYVTLVVADRIAWALDIPLPLLAEEFVPFSQIRKMS